LLSTLSLIIIILCPFTKIIAPPFHEFFLLDFSFIIV